MHFPGLEKSWILGKMVEVMEKSWNFCFWFKYFMLFENWRYSLRVSNLWTIMNRDNKRLRREFLEGPGGMLPQKIVKIGSLKTSFSALSGQNMWQNGTENW